MRSVLLVLSVTLLPVVGAMPALASEADLDWQVIPSELCRGLWMVELSKQGEPDASLRMILDTGASVTAVDPDAIERVFGRRVRAGRRARLRNLELGPLKVRRIRVESHEMDHLARALGTEMDGILGFPVFEDLLLALDYPEAQIRVAEGALPPLDETRVFRDYGKVRPYLVLELQGERVPVLIDSGSAGGLQLQPSDPVSWQVEPRPLSAAVRYSEIRVEETGRSAETYDFGPLDVEQPVIDLADGTRLAGFRVLRRFEWVFDTRSRRIRMTPDHEGAIESPPFLGLGAAWNPKAEGLHVVRVFPNTPAAHAGLRQGDVVTAVDGQSIYARSCWSFRTLPVGTEVTLSVRRGEELLALKAEVEILVP